MKASRSLLIVAGAAALLAACGQSNEKAAEAPATPAAPAAAPGTPEAMLASLPAPYNSGDLLNGKAKFAACRSCHTIKDGGSNGVGPNLYGMFGRHVAYAKGYKYSAALKEQDFIWDAEKLDQWLTKPKEFIPGTKMTFKGLPEQKDRIDLIAYLKVSTGYKP